jgi:hypothetical protein
MVGAKLALCVGVEADEGEGAVKTVVDRRRLRARWVFAKAQPILRLTHSILM